MLLRELFSQYGFDTTDFYQKPKYKLKCLSMDLEITATFGMGPIIFPKDEKKINYDCSMPYPISRHISNILDIEVNIKSFIDLDDCKSNEEIAQMIYDTLYT